MAYARFLLICVIWGSSFILMKKAYLAFGPVTIAGLRAASGAAILLLLWHALRRGAHRRWPLGRAQLLPLMVPVLIGFVYPYVMQPHLVGKHQDSAYFGMMVALVPLLTIVVSVPVLRMWPRWRELAGVLVGLVCMVLLGGVGEARGVPWYDFVLAATMPTSYAVSNTVIKRVFHDVPPMALTCSGLALAGLLLLPTGLAGESVKTADAQPMTVAVLSVGVLGVLGTGVAMYLFNGLIQSHGPLFAGMVTYLVPLGALVWGWLDDERVTAAQLVAMGGIFLGVALVQWPGRSARAAAQQTPDTPTGAVVPAVRASERQDTPD